MQNRLLDHQLPDLAELLRASFLVWYHNLFQSNQSLDQRHVLGMRQNLL